MVAVPLCPPRSSRLYGVDAALLDALLPLYGSAAVRAALQPIRDAAPSHVPVLPDPKPTP